MVQVLLRLAHSRPAARPPQGPQVNQMTKLFPPSPLAAAQAFLLSLPAVRFEGLAGLCPAHEPETARSAGELHSSPLRAFARAVYGGGRPGRRPGLVDG